MHVLYTHIPFTQEPTDPNNPDRNAALFWALLPQLFAQLDAQSETEFEFWNTQREDAHIIPRTTLRQSANIVHLTDAENTIIVYCIVLAGAQLRIDWQSGMWDWTKLPIDTRHPRHRPPFYAGRWATSGPTLSGNPCQNFILPWDPGAHHLPTDPNNPDRNAA